MALVAPTVIMKVHSAQAGADHGEILGIKGGIRCCNGAFTPTYPAHITNHTSPRIRELCTQMSRNHQDSLPDRSRLHHDASPLKVPRPTPSKTPQQIHRWNCERSCLALAVAGSFVFAGTQGGDILIHDTTTFQRIRTLHAHSGSVLGFCLDKHALLLFSSGSDRITNIWDTQTFEHVASIYSLYDVGDIYTVSFSSRSQTIYLGSQNTSIQWCNVANIGNSRPVNPRSHPSQRQDRFFDSTGPGGVRTPRPEPDNALDTRSGELIEIEKTSIQQFAHYGYVYCTLLTTGSSLGLVSEDEYLLSGGGDGVINIWSLDKSTGAIKNPVKLQDRAEEGNSILSFALDSGFLYAGRSSGQVNVWDLETRQLIRRLEAHHDEILAISVGRNLILAGALDGQVIKFNRRYENINAWPAHQGRILSSTFATIDDKTLYITGSNDDTVAIWNIEECAAGLEKGSLTSQEELFDTLRSFVSYRTVSSDANHREDCRRGASFIRGLLKKLGAATAMLTIDASYNPVVFARFSNKNKASEGKTVLFYGHYDVVPAADRHKKWQSDPFTLIGQDGYLYGRGVSDNKGPITAAVYAAAELSATNALEGDIIFLLEGEEECGSRGFQEAIRAYKDFIGHVDWICLANSYWLDDEVPCLTYGLRGVIHATVEVQSTEPDLHSGVDGSCLLDEPLKDLIAVVSRLNGPGNKVDIPGFYDQVLPITNDEKRLYDEIATTLLDRSPELGSHASITASLMARWRDAALTIHGFRTSGSEKSTIIPSRAAVSLSMRIVPNQDIEEISQSLKMQIQRLFAALDSKNSLTVTIDHKAEPWLGDFQNDIFKCFERAVSSVWSRHRPQPRRPSTAKSPPTSAHGLKQPAPATSSKLASATSPLRSESLEKLPSISSIQGLPSPIDNVVSSDGGSLEENPRKPLYIREGGSIPAIRFLEKEFDAPAAHLPCGQASDNAHLDNERLRVVNLLNSREIFRRVFSELPRL